MACYTHCDYSRGIVRNNEPARMLRRANPASAATRAAAERRADACLPPAADCRPRMHASRGLGRHDVEHLQPGGVAGICRCMRFGHAAHTCRAALRGLLRRRPAFRRSPTRPSLPLVKRARLVRKLLEVGGLQRAHQGLRAAQGGRAR